MGRPGPQVVYASESVTSSPSQSSVFQKIDEFDKQLSLRVHGRGLVVPRWILQLLEYSGDGLLSIPLTGALWLAPILLDRLELRSFLFNLFVAFIFDLVLNGAMKSLIRRPRPIYNKGMYMVLSVDQHSFPSGHSSRALMIAAFFWLHIPMWKNLLASRTDFWEYGNEGYFPAPEACLGLAISIWALATATSRVLLGRHYVLDVLVGSLLGILQALFVHDVLFVPKDVSHGIYASVLGVFKQP